MDQNRCVSSTPSEVTHVYGACVTCLQVGQDMFLTPKLPVFLPSLRMSVAVSMVRPNFTEQDRGNPFSKAL